MDDKSKEVTLGMPAGVGGTHRPAGWSGRVTENEHEHLVAAGALAEGQSGPDAEASHVATLHALLDEALVENGKLEKQLEQQRLDADQRIAKIQTDADKRIADTEAKAAKQVKAAEKSGDDKVATLQAELEALKAKSTK